VFFWGWRLGGTALTIKKIEMEEKPIFSDLNDDVERYKNFVHQSFDAICLTDEVGNIIEWNKFQELISGLSFDYVFNRKVWDVQFEMAIGEIKQPENLVRIEQMFKNFYLTGDASFLNKTIEMPIKTTNNQNLLVQQNSFSIKTSKGFLLASVSRDITKIKQTENELIAAKEKAEENEKKLESIIDNLQDAFFKADLTGNFIYVNSFAAIMFGYTEYELIGLPASNLYADPKERNKLIERLKKEINIFDWIGKGLRKDGSTFWVSMNIQFAKNHQGKIIGTEGIVRDISEQKKAENEIALNNERLESLLRISQFSTNSIQELLDFALSEALKLTNSKIGYIYYYNEITQQFVLNAWSKGVLQECQILNQQTVYDLDNTGCWGEAVRQRKPIIINDYQAENKLKKGSPEGHAKLFNFLTIPVIIDNKIVAVAGVANKNTDYNNTDVHQLTLLMDSMWRISERIALIKDLTEAKEKAEESDRLKSSFLKNMSHEVRTPINAIAGFSQLIIRPNQTPEKLKKFSEIIVENSDKLINIITDVIEISQIQSQIIKPQLTEFDIISFLTSIANEFKVKAIEKGLELKLKMDINFQEYVIKSDSEKLNRIIFHLIDNAIKFTNQGIVNIVSELENENIKIAISDTGIGISDEMQNVIFEPFRQVETGTCRNFGGNGLGLSIAKAYTELLNGNISLKSEINKGTTICISIPTNKISFQISKVLTDNKKYSVNTILIVEDEYSNYQYLLALLEEKGLKTLYASNGQQAVDLCKANSEIDLVLMDIKMPIMDGITAAKLIKSFRSNIPIIAQTAYIMESEQETFVELFKDYITKPISEEVLNQKLIKYIDK